MDKKIENINNFHENKEELFLNEYNWNTSKDTNEYSFKIGLNINNTILFSCSITNTNKEKFYYENISSLRDLHYYDRFKNIEKINDIYIYLLNMVQENQYDFEQKEENKILLIIKPYTKSEKLFEFILNKKDTNKKCEICDRVHSGINYLRFIRDHNNNNIISSNNNISYNINCNYNNINNNGQNNDKNLMTKIMEEINLLKKENLLKNEQIKKLNKEIFELKQNQIIREDIDNNQLNVNKYMPIKIPKTNINNEIKDNNSLMKNNGKKIYLKSNVQKIIFFNGNPIDLKYKCTIVKDTSAKGVNDIFEVFVCNKDSKEYLISKNAKTHCLDVILLKDNKIITSLKGHTNTITMVRYFFNYKGKNEYLISADKDGNVIVWDINNDYSILHFIKTEYISNNIYSCYIYFDNFDNNYIFTSCGLNKYEKNDTSFTKMYSFKDGSFIKNINNTNVNNTYYLLMWHDEHDEQNKNNYLIECCEEKIAINDFKNNLLYTNLLAGNFQVLKYYNGTIFYKSGKSYLFSSTSNGYLVIWDLLSKTNIFYIKISPVELYNTVLWNNNCFIISGGRNQNFIIFNIDYGEVVGTIQIEKSSNINCVKKIVHPIYGESIITSGNDHKIRIFAI